MTKFYAIDTETVLFKDPVYDPTGRTRIEPPDVPDMICGSFCLEDTDPANPKTTSGVLYPKELVWLVNQALWLSEDNHVIFHNIAFDVPVILKAAESFLDREAYVSLVLSLRNAVLAGRVHDTQILEVLLNLATGKDLTPRALVYQSLAKLARERCGITLNKDEAIRLNFAQYQSRLDQLPSAFREYAIADAEATLQVFRSQYREAQLYAGDIANAPGILPEVRENPFRWGPLTEAIQVAGAIGLAFLQREPVYVDQPAAQAAVDKYVAEANTLEASLVESGLAKRAPKSGKFSLKLKEVRRHLKALADKLNITPPLSPTGLIKTEADFWASHIPAGHELAPWMRHTKIRKLLTAFLFAYSASPVHYPRYTNCQTRTGRTSASRFNIQQTPKRRDSLRHLVVARPGHVLIEADYKAAELVTLAQIYHLRYGGSTLGDAINSGEDPHIGTAARLQNKPLDQVTKKERQLAKAINFGLPGGLGARKFAMYARKSYGVDMTEMDAQITRALALRLDPSLKAYLADDRDPERVCRLAAKNLMMTEDELVDALDAWSTRDAGEVNGPKLLRNLRAFMRNPADFPDIIPPPGMDPIWDTLRQATYTPTGRIRGRASYTEQRNTPFQGLAADGAKLGLFRLWATSECMGRSFRLVAFIHDAILIECPDDMGSIDVATETIEYEMTAGLAAVCPDVRVTTEVSKPAPHWGAV